MISVKSLYCGTKSSSIKQRNRKGAIAVLAAILMVVMLAMVAFVVDIGYLVSARAEMQRSADAAALAGAWEMVSDEALSDDYLSMINYAARQTAAEVAAKNEVIQTHPSMRLFEDIDVGQLHDPSDRKEALSFSNPSKFNTVQVRLQYDGTHNKAISFFFAPVLGVDSADLAVTAAATFSDNKTVGFRITENVENCTLTPFAVKIDDWLALLAGSGDDNWSYDPETGEVSPGQDGIRELKMYPQKEVGNSITPGNFGTVDVGDPNNSGSDLVRQIRDGVSSEDLSFFENGELKLNPETGKIMLNGDTGITTSMKTPLAEVVGKPRSICLYESAADQGNTTDYTIVGFAGIRVLDVKLTGNDKYVLIQPGVVADASAIVGDTETSYFIGPPVFLVR